MLVIEFKLTGFSVKRGMLFGSDRDAPILTIRGGFFCISVMQKKGKEMLIETMRGLGRDPRWLIKNYGSVVNERERARDEAIESVKRENSIHISRLQDRAYIAEEENRRLRTELHTLSRAIEIIGGPNDERP